MLLAAEGGGEELKIKERKKRGCKRRMIRKTDKLVFNVYVEYRKFRSAKRQAMDYQE